MSLLFISRPYHSETKREGIRGLVENAAPDRDFYLLVIGAVLLALCGILLDSIAVLIASMIVAPLALPILALGLGIVAGDVRLAARSIGTLIISLVIATVTAFFAALAFGHLGVDRVFISFSSNETLATVVAVIAGAIAAYGFMRPKVGGAFTGIGIAVSLMPPLVASGMGVASADPALAQTAFILFVLNVAGILAGSIAMFAAFGMGREYRAVRKGEGMKI